MLVYFGSFNTDNREKKLLSNLQLPIMTECSTWTALRNPVFRQLWLASVISGSCVAAHDGAATWMMNKLTGSPFLISLMSTMASLSFFLLTLPGGLLGDKGMVCETPH